MLSHLGPDYGWFLELQIDDRWLLTDDGRWSREAGHMVRSGGTQLHGGPAHVAGRTCGTGRKARGVLRVEMLGNGASEDNDCIAWMYTMHAHRGSVYRSRIGHSCLILMLGSDNCSVP